MDVGELLDFERRWGTRRGKSEAIRTELGLSAPRYYQLLNRAIDSVEALEQDPELAARLLRAREAHRQQRQDRITGR